MGRRAKKRSGAAAAEPVDEDAAVRRGASVKAIRTWDDVEHESADEFDAAKDRVLIGHTKRRGRRGRGNDSDESDQEVLGVRTAGGSSDEASSDDGDGDNAAFYSDSDANGSDVDEAGAMEDGAWGKQKHNYYDADDIGTDTDDDEAAAKEEEEEALRLQRQQLEALDEGDFIDELGAQLGVDAGGASRLVSTVDDSAQTLLDLDSVALDGALDMSDAKRQALLRLPEREKLKVLQAESPELLSLAADMKAQWTAVRDQIKPVLDRAAALGVRADDHPALAFYAARFQLAMSYVNNIAVYLALKASTPEQRAGTALRDHPVIGAIVEFRRRLEMMDALQERLAPLLDLFAEELASGSVSIDDAAASDVEMADAVPVARAEESRKQKSASQEKPHADKPRAASRRKASKSTAQFLSAAAAAPTDSYRELQAMLKKGKRKHKQAQSAHIGSWDALEDGDLGDQDRLEDADAEDKARAIRRLRNHAKRVVQARGRREARGKVSGDADLPYKSRSESLRLDGSGGVAQDGGDDLGADLGMDLDSDVGEAPKDDYYSQVVQRKAQEQAAKDERRQEQWRHMVAANQAEEAAVDDAAKRSVNYQILKNKGLLPRRAKDNRNPRVKRRKRYEKAQKKLGSAVAQVRSLEGNYGGEATGIKPALSRSTRFAH
ncbi:something about silencing protein 10 [Coemansia sp. RSA 2611]|nr:something about silencing protein 10 [Coemansia sp. RSA 2611]